VVAPVEEIRRVPGMIEVFGIEVEYFHNYFVGSGDNAMLVHNGPEKVAKPLEAVPGRAASDAKLNKAAFGTREHYPGTLDQPFTGSFADLTNEIQSVYPGFKGFEENVAGVPGGTAWFNPRTQKIEFGISFNQTTRGLVAEETRHALDFAQGVDLRATMAAFKAETGLDAARNVNQFSLWHHRRVYTRMLQDADRGHPVMSKIIGKGDIPSIYDTYTSPDACGTSALDWLLKQNFTNPFHSAP
jgi:hypothetical protein